MAHLIESAAFSAREGAGWTGLGREIPAADARNPAAIAALIGATYTVEAREAYYKAPDGTYQPISGAAVQVRSDNGKALSVTSDSRYNTDNRQPLDVLEAFRDQLNRNQIEVSHAAVLDAGRKIAVSGLLSPDFDMHIKGTDRVQRYVTLSTGYDKKHGTICTHGMIRVVCANTLAMSIAAAMEGTNGKRGENRKGDRILRYTASQVIEAGGLAAMLEDIHNVGKVELAAFNDMANRAMSEANVARFFADVLEINIEDLNRTDNSGKQLISTKSRNMLAALVDSYKTAPGAAMASGNAWGALNAVTHYATHIKTVRDTSGDGAGAARVNSNLFGDSARLKARALSLLVNQYAVALGEIAKAGGKAVLKLLAEQNK
jgi:phage/plasmid-like protein (TIGR03299 family)